MRIALVADCWHPVVNGVVTSVDILRGELVRAGHDVHLYVPGAPGVNETDPRVHRFFSVTAPFHHESRFCVPYPFRHVQHFLQHPPDVVHIHTPFNLGTLFEVLAWLKGRRFVFTHHTLWEEYVHYVPLVSPRYLKPLAIAITRGISNRSRGVVAPSEEVRDRLLEQGVVQPIAVIPTGIDLHVFEHGEPDRVRRELGIPVDAPVAIYAGRMGKEKSLDFLIEAFARVVKRVPEARLLLLGDGPEREPLQGLASRLGLDGRAIFTGYVARPSMVHYLKAARVFLFASTTETQGLVSLEAQAAGCPVVAVRASGSSEAVKDGESGFLVPQDLDAFAEHAARVLTDDALQRRLAEGAGRQAWDFSSVRMAQRHLELYQQAAEAPF